MGNNTCNEAEPIGPGAYSNCNVHALDHDYYAVDLVAGQTLELREADEERDVEWKLYDSDCITELDAGAWTLNYTANLAKTVIIQAYPWGQWGCSHYDFDVNVTNQVGTTFCDPANANCSEASTQIAGTFPQTVGSGLHLSATTGPAGEFGYFLVSFAMNEPGMVLSNGNLCLGEGFTPIQRYKLQGGDRNSLGRFSNNGLVYKNLVGTGTSTSNTGIDVPETMPGNGNAMILSGMRLHFQLWHRHSCLNQGESNFSNGLTVRF